MSASDLIYSDLFRIEDEKLQFQPSPVASEFARSGRRLNCIGRVPVQKLKASLASYIIYIHWLHEYVQCAVQKSTASKHGAGDKISKKN